MGFNPLQTGLLVAIPPVAYVLAQPFVDRLADKVSASLTIKVGLALSGLSIILVPFVSQIAAMVIVFIVAGVGIATALTNTDIQVSNLTKGRKKGITAGASGPFKEIGDMLGPLLIGAVSQAFGLTVGFLFCGVLGLLALALISARQLRPGIPQT